MKKRFSLSQTFQQHSADEGLTSLAGNLSLTDQIADRQWNDSHSSKFKWDFLARAKRRLSLSTSRIMDIQSHNSSQLVPDEQLKSPETLSDDYSTTRRRMYYNRKRSNTTCKVVQTAIVHEHPQIGSDGESEEASGASDEIVSPVKMRPERGRRNDISKRLSLPANVHLPESFLAKQTVSPTLDGPISRTVRRQSLSEIGFGRKESYLKSFKLGEGTYATVYLGKSLLTGVSVALKEIKLEQDEGAPCTAIREISLLKDLKHNNIVTLHDIIHTEKCLTLVFEFMETDLHKILDSLKPTGSGLPTKQIQIFLFQLLRGLAYCHRRKVLHRDLKPQNLLINSMGELKLADFGLARAKSVPTKTYSNEVCTLWYRPPDVLEGSTDYSTSIDMWGVGCIFYEMATCFALFPACTVGSQIISIDSVLGAPDSNREPRFPHILRLSTVYLDLLKKLLKHDPKSRISAMEAMRHETFNDLGPEVQELSDTDSIFLIPSIASLSSLIPILPPEKKDKMNYTSLNDVSANDVPENQNKERSNLYCLVSDLEKAGLKVHKIIKCRDDTKQFEEVAET